MMDYTCYFEEQFNARYKGENNLNVSTELTENLPTLTDEENAQMFHDFEDNKIFIGTFTGPGQTYLVAGDKQMKTWAFKDENDSPWLIPQWLTLDAPQGSFEGFSKEIPGKYIYQIEYIDLIQVSNGHRHNVTVFRKKS